jgi:DNA repair exonuclease SbcCD ATPase subunit
MKLLKLKAHNVFSIGDVELDLKDQGLLLVTGWSHDEKNGNMAGKSSVANRVPVWGLYGRTVDGIKADAVINTSIKNAKHCAVTVWFEGIDGCEYRIYRSRKPNELVLSVRNVGEDEWGDLSKRNEKDTQQLINALLGRDHKTFIQSDFFGQGRERSFLALPGGEQRAVIEEILPLNSLDSWCENAKSRVREVQAMIDETQTGCRAQAERVSMASAHAQGLDRQANKWRDDYTQSLTTARENLAKVQQISSGIEDELVTLKDAMPRGCTSQEALSQKTKASTDLTLSNNTINYRIDTLTGNIDRRAARPDVCVSCDQALPSEKIEENQVALEADKVTREVFIKQRAENEVKLYALNSDMGICREALVLEVRLAERGQEATLTEQIRQLEAAPNPFNKPLIAANDQHAEEFKELDTLKGLLFIQEGIREDYRFWQNAFGKDIKTLLFEHVCPFLEQKTNQYLRDLQNGQIKVKFSTSRVLKSGDERDQFCVTASSDTGSTVYELFSGAEKQLTSFAVGMALSDLAGMQTEGASSFMILDEPFLYQSPENCERIVQFITHHLGGKATILLISNEDSLVNLVPNRVHVVKKKGVTSIDG